MIQLKQLKRLKYESFDYGKYEKLKKLFLDIDFEPETVEELELQNEKAPTLPNMHCLELLTNLNVLILSHNLIQRFPGLQLAKALPKLQVFDISSNHVEELDDLIDMGILEDLRILDIQGNYVCNYVSRIDMIENLLCPKKYVKYNPVKILTAGYNQIPVARLKGHAFEQQKQDRRVIERNPEELRPDELRNTVSKYNHKNTLGKYSLEACPIPRKTRFKNLEYLNGEAITKLEIIRVTGVKNFKQVLENVHELKQQASEKQKLEKNKVEKKNKKIHEQYIKKYLKRIGRMMDEIDETAIPKKKGDLDVEEMMVQLTQKEIKSKNRPQIDPKKFSQELWMVPLDVQYKDSEFAIGIEDFKKQQQQYIEEKNRKQEQRKFRQKERRRKRLEKRGIVIPEDDPDFDEDSDPEIRRMFRMRKKQMKPKLNLSRDEDRDYRSSESSLAESQSSKSRSEYQREEEEDDEVSDDQQTTMFRQSKYQTFVNPENNKSAMALRRQIQSEQKSRRVTFSRQKQSEPTTLKKQENKQEAPARAQTASYTHSQTHTRQPTYLHSQHKDTESQQHVEQEISPRPKNNEDVKLYPEGPSVIFSYNNHNESPTLQIQQFRLGQAPIPGNRLLTATVREQTKDSFSVRNKLSAPHQPVTTKDIENDKLTQLERRKEQAERERRELDEMRQSNPVYKIIEDQNKKERPITSFKMDDPKPHRRSSLQKQPKKELQQSQSVKQEDFQKIKIPLESLLPTEEQGIPQELRMNLLLDTKGEKYKELLHYKRILEESKNIRLQSGQPAGGMSQFKASDFEQVFNFLKTDPNFKIQSCYDPANQIVANVMKKKRGETVVPDKKISTFEMREIIYGANEYDPQKEPKLVEKEIIQELDKDEDLNPEQRIKLYQWLEILDDINLKKTKTDEKRLQRIEKKEIERAQSFAHLAYHYQKLKKYVDEEKLQKYVKLMGIPLDEIIQENQAQSKIQRGGTGNKQQRIIISSKSRQVKSAVQLRKKKDPDVTKETNRIVQDKADLIDDQAKINAKRLENHKQELLSDTGYMAENHPNIVTFLKEKEKQRAEIVKPQLTFEEMMDQNIRRLQDQFQKKGGTGALTLEEQMMRYAQEFNEKVKNRERLKANMKQYIESTQKKIDEFWQWEANEREFRNDKTACFKRYVRLVREGQIKVI